MASSKILNYGVDLYKLRVNPGGTIDIDVVGGEFRVDGNLVVDNIRPRNDDNNLSLLSNDSNGVVSVESVSNYEQRVFSYDNQGKITQNSLVVPTTPDALINAQAMIDYLDSYFFYNVSNGGVAGFQIVATDDSGTKVIAEAEVDKQVRILVNNSEVATFTETETNLITVLISNQIITPDNADLVLNPSANVNVSNSRITNLADPINSTDAVNKQYLEELLTDQLGTLLDFDTSNLVDGSMLVFSEDLGKFQAQTLLDNQTIDAGIY